MEEVIKVKAIVKFKRHYRGTYGVYEFKAVEPDNKVKTDWTGMFVVSGDTFELIEGNEYELEIVPFTHPQYGDQYKFVSVKQNKPTTVKQQQEYIRALLTDKQAEAIISKYPNEKILDLIKENKFDYSDIHGIGDKTYQKIRKMLLENLGIQEVITELKDLNISFKAIKKLIDHFGSAELVVQKVKENIYELCKVKSFGFKTVDKYALNRGDSKTNPNRIRAAIDYVLSKEEESGHTWITKFSLQEKLKELLEIDRKYIEAVINNLNEKQFYIDKTRVAKKFTYNQELDIKNKLLNLLKAKSKLKIDNYEEKIKEIEEMQGFKFTDEQRKAIDMSIKNNVLIINGKAGTGKTSVLKGIIKAHSNYNHVVCALSGKAANVVSQMGLNGSTIHRALGLGVGEERLKALGEDGHLPYHIVVLDEASMVNVYLFNKLIQAVKEGYKLIILGDSGQLESVGCGAVFRDLINSKSIPRIELTKVQRQAQMSGILSSANEIREGKQIVKSNGYGRHSFGELNDFFVYAFNGREEMLSFTFKIAEKFKGKNIMDFQIIAGRNSEVETSVENLNKQLQKIFNDTTQKGIKHYKTNYYKGDKIIQIGNNYKAGENKDTIVFNGTLGRIVDVKFGIQEEGLKKKNDYIYIKFEGIDEIITYSNEELDQIYLAYAITAHRSQGSTIKNVIFICDFNSYTLLSRQFLYTGITRASEWCMVICELGAFRKAVTVDASEDRRTFLAELLN